GTQIVISFISGYALVQAAIGIDRLDDGTRLLERHRGPRRSDDSGNDQHHLLSEGVAFESGSGAGRALEATVDRYGGAAGRETAACSAPDHRRLADLVGVRAGGRSNPHPVLPLPLAGGR